MKESDFQELIDRRGIVVVHFSHLAVMSHKIVFPRDLQHAITHYESENRSCCALWPGHRMQLPGCVGVIFRPTFEQVLSVLADDSGSSDFGATEQSAGEIPSERTILESLKVPPGRYNEWRVRGAAPSGIFVANPASILAKQEVELDCGVEKIKEINSVPIKLSQVSAAFPELQLFTMKIRGLERLPRLDSV